MADYAVSKTEQLRPICILQTVTSVCAGGLSRYLVDLLSHLDPKLYETHLVCTHFEGPHFNDARPYVGSTTVLTARNQIDKIRLLTRVMRKLKPHVVHAHQEPVALIAASLAGVPIRMETIHLAHYWLADGHPLTRVIARRCATTHVVCSEAEKALVAPPAARHKVKSINPGIDASRWAGYWNKITLPCSDRLPDGAFVVGTVARLEQQKGITHLVNAFPEVLRRYPTACLLIVGDGGLRRDLEQQAAELGIADRVVFTGYQLDAYRYLGAMDVFVMPSLFESWGFTAVEAMGAGLPVICSDIPGPRDFIVHERTGLLVPIADPTAIAHAVLRVWEDSALRHTLCVNGKLAVMTQHSVQSMARQYETLYSCKTW